MFIPAHVNLADIYRAQQREADAYNVLMKAIQAAAGNADVHHALGLLLVRQRKTDKAVQELEAATRLAPQNARYIYVYAVALNSTGRADEALKQLQIAHDRFPSNVEILQALIAFNRDAGNAFAAQRYMKKLESLQ